MHLLGAILEERPHIILQLRATHDGVVAEHHALILQQSGVGNQFHLGHQCPAFLIARGKRAGPRRSVFQHGTLVGHALSLGIA